MHALRLFVVVAEELHFGRAAARLHMAQPPLSQQIRQLEANVGADLFVRTTRSVQLTEAGMVLFDRARQLLADADAAEQAVVRAAHGETGRISLGFHK
ncbi:LysR family transcriptional regulator [Cupriavidus basilensis]